MTRGTVFTATLGANKKGAKRLVWLHGWGQTHQSLIPLASLFQKDFSNLLYDLPGFGKSEMLASGAGTADYADVLIADLEKEKSPAVLIGHSFGGRVAIRTAAKRPDLVEALVLIAAAGLPRKRSIGFKFKSIALKALSRVAKLSDGLFKTAFRNKFQTRFGSRDYRNAGALRPTFVATVTENLSETAARVTCPVLLIYGAEDTETPPEIGERYAALMRGGTLKIVDRFGHLNILTAGKHQCQHLMGKFLTSLGKA